MLENRESVDHAPLDAPLTLPADQLELVAGGMTLAKVGPIGPTNGLYQVVKLDTLAPISLQNQVAF